MSSDEQRKWCEQPQCKGPHDLTNPYTGAYAWTCPGRPSSANPAEPERCEHGMTEWHIDDDFLTGERVVCPGPSSATTPEPERCACKCHGAEGYGAPCSEVSPCCEFAGAEPYCTDCEGDPAAPVVRKEPDA